MRFFANAQNDFDIQGFYGNNKIIRDVTLIKLLASLTLKMATVTSYDFYGTRVYGIFATISKNQRK
jgi:hypothetical protein